MKPITNFQFIALATVFFLAACSGHQETKQRSLSAATIAVKTAKVQFAEHNNVVSATGLITTENEAKYAFKIGGVIDRIYVREGQSFSKGQLLASLKLTEIESGVNQAAFGLEKAQRDYQRVSHLYQDSVATLEQLQNTKTAMDIAQKQWDAAAFNKQYAFVYASNGGFVTKKIANEGEVVAGGYPVLAINETVGATAWVLKAGLSDKEWATVQIGNEATVSIDAFPNQLFKAVVSKKLLAADQASGSFQIELKIEMAQAKPAVGMYAKAQIETGSKQRHASIPYSALIEADGDQAFVFVPQGQAHIKKLPVTIAGFDNSEVRIAAGLENVAEVIVANTAFLNEKSVITIQK